MMGSVSSVIHMSGHVHLCGSAMSATMVHFREGLVGTPILSINSSVRPWLAQEDLPHPMHASSDVLRPQDLPPFYQVIHSSSIHFLTVISGQGVGQSNRKSCSRRCSVFARRLYFL
ncbi:hypothetical protein OPV22_030982 [Ensete ventricosum]|uniref:Uncharacterized protein n=1 Tax=Ensete ventricosum TaxID=4639 RepID=A0AAV8PK32_ENSVE|nr:hypothetical protein OPV22_030982 [Ensete ventricosum]